MTDVSDIAKVIEQEERLVFSAFDEVTAFEIGSAIRSRGQREKSPVVIEIRVWDRLLFHAALSGSTISNADWVRRKINVVKMFHKSTYRLVLERDRPDRTFKVGDGLSPSDYVLAGGGFPVAIKDMGAVGVIAVSGLPEREDHSIIVEALCDYLNIPRQDLALSTKARA